MPRPASSLDKNDLPPECNVVTLHARVTDHHLAYLARWLKAGQRMGLCDADIVSIDSACGKGVQRQVVVWVRESADPAYLIGPAGLKWVVFDAIRDNVIGEYRSFEHALAAIRPVIALKEKPVGRAEPFLLQG